MSRTIIAVLFFAAACGGSTKHEDTTVSDEGGGGDDSGGGGDPCADSGGMCPPEMLQEIQADLDRKRDPATRCLTNAIDDGDVDKNTAGKIALVFKINTDGKAEDIEVTKSTIDNQGVQDCVKKLVANISFPNVPKTLDWSYTFAFEAF